jgi:hypothetical protein
MFVIIILSGQIYQIVATVTVSDSFYILLPFNKLKVYETWARIFQPS